MKIPCAKKLSFVVHGFSFLEVALTNAQYQNLVLIATALILGAKFNLSEISRMWLKDRSIGALSEFLSDAKLSSNEMQHLYLLRVLHLYKIKDGYFLIDDTMKHHTKFCKCITSSQTCGFETNEETGKKEKVFYHVKFSTVRLNAMPGKHRLVENFDPNKKTTKYLLTNELTWDATKIISVYSYRWVIEEFFRNAKQLTDMEGVTISSEPGVTLSLCLVSWIDFLLHYENYKQSTAGKLTKESLTIPSIVRQLQFENPEAFLDRVQRDEKFVVKLLAVTQEDINRNRKKANDLVLLGDSNEQEEKPAA